MIGHRANVAAVAAWAVVTPLALVAAARLAVWDASDTLVALNALTPVLYLPAWPVAVVAGVGRRWALLGAALAVVVAHAGFVLPELAAAERIPDAARTAPRLRLFSANVFAGNHEVEGYADEIRRAGSDLVVLQEATPAFVDRLDATGALAALPHRVSVPRDDPFAMLVASRWPIRDEEVVAVRGRPVLVEATVEPAGTPIRLFAVHAVSPVGGGDRAEWSEDLGRIASAVKAEQLPVLVAGDLNATWGHRAFRRLLDAGLTDAAAARGRPFQMTWPRHRRLLPPVARIDHVLTTGQLVVLRIESGVGRGSDHRPLLADVALPR